MLTCKDELLHTNSTSGLTREERTRRTREALELAAGREEPERSEILNEVVTWNLPVASSISHRFRNRGVSVEDLEQVAFLALTKAAHAFDASRGDDFLVFAVPTIRGELKRHFRDVAWTVRPPRRIQELQAAIMTATDELYQELGRAPQVVEIAERVGSTTDDVAEAVACGGCFNADSLDDRGPDGESRSASERLGEPEQGFGHVEAVSMLAPACRQLKERDRRILYLRFYRGQTQSQIAQELGVTQMQVSRLITRILKNLRDQLETAPPAAVPHAPAA